MASPLAVAFKRLASSSSPSLLRAICPSSTTVSRLIHTGSSSDSDSDDDRNESGNYIISLTRRPGTDISSEDAWSTALKHPYRTCGMGAGGSPRGYDAKETEEDLRIRFDMPGLSKADVKVGVVYNTLVIKINGYIGRFGLPAKVYLTDKMRTEVKNGELIVVLPKINKKKP